jgi:RNA polymerase sigma-70 factor (ECF subfamily)
VDADLDLLEEWRAGDQTAGQALFARHFEDVYRFFAHKCRGDADELVQQTFLACVRARDQFRGQSTFRTYLFAVARHELYHHLRKLRRDDERLDFAVTSIGEIVTTPGSRIAREQEAERLREALATLPAEQQLLLELCYWHELEPTQLAEIFEIPAVTVRTRLFRARQALRERLGDRAGSSDPLIRALQEPETT